MAGQPFTLSASQGVSDGGTEALLMVRPEWIALSTAPLAEPGRWVSFQGSIETHSFLGKTIRYWLTSKLSDTPITVDEDAAQVHETRSGKVWLNLNLQRARLLPRHEGAAARLQAAS